MVRVVLAERQVRCIGVAPVQVRSRSAGLGDDVEGRLCQSRDLVNVAQDRVPQGVLEVRSWLVAADVRMVHLAKDSGHVGELELH